MCGTTCWIRFVQFKLWYECLRLDRFYLNIISEMSSNISKVIVFGASGNTGLATVEAALKVGYEVTAFVRKKEKLGTVKPSHVIEGDVLNKEVVSRAIKDHDAAIIVLGTRNDLSPTTVMSEGTKNILDGMKSHNVKRVTCCISSFLFWPREKVPKPYIPLTEDHERMLEALKVCDREWVAVLPPHIAEEPARGNYVIKNEAPVGKMISKYDLAEILVKCLTTEEFIGHYVGIGYPE